MLLENNIRVRQVLLLENKTLDPDIFSLRIVHFFDQIKVEKKPEIKVAISYPRPPKPSICQKNERGKKPFYCKWWFWGLMMIPVAGGAAIGGGDDTVTISW